MNWKEFKIEHLNHLASCVTTENDLRNIFQWATEKAKKEVFDALEKDYPSICDVESYQKIKSELVGVEQVRNNVQSRRIDKHGNKLS